MKKKIYKQTIILVACLLFVLDVNAQSEFMKDDFDKLSFSVQTNKSDYFPLEPILLRFEVSNTTEEDLKLNTRPDPKRISVEITFNGIVKSFSSPFLIGPGRSGLGDLFEKGQILNKDVLLDTYLDEMFPEYGKYQVSIILNNGRDDEMKASTRSNTFEITIKKPTGINKAAIEFLRQNQNQSLFWWKEKNDEASIASTGKPLIENFANKYSKSVFGEYAALLLGQHYSNSGEIERAKIEFEKIKGSSNKYVAENAKERLFELKKKGN